MAFQLPKAFISSYAEMFSRFKPAENSATEMDEKPEQFSMVIWASIVFYFGDVKDTTWNII